MRKHLLILALMLLGASAQGQDIVYSVYIKNLERWHDAADGGVAGLPYNSYTLDAFSLKKSPNIDRIQNPCGVRRMASVDSNWGLQHWQWATNGGYRIPLP